MYGGVQFGFAGVDATGALDFGVWVAVSFGGGDFELPTIGRSVAAIVGGDDDGTSGSDDDNGGGVALATADGAVVPLAGATALRELATFPATTTVATMTITSTTSAAAAPPMISPVRALGDSTFAVIEAAPLCPLATG